MHIAGFSVTGFVDNGSLMLPVSLPGAAYNMLSHVFQSYCRYNVWDQVSYLP